MKKVFCIIYYILMALPIPVSLISWLGTLISIGNLDMIGGKGIVGLIHRIVALLTMLLEGTYLFSFNHSLKRTKMVKRVTFTMFLPVLHIIATCVCMFLWAYFDNM